jgi:uncharacterized protein with GYD domain
MVQARLPEEDISDQRDPDARIQEIEGSLLPLDGTLLSHSFTLGAEFDEVMIIEVPETIAVTACVMAAIDGGSGRGKVKATRLINTSWKFERFR